MSIQVIKRIEGEPLKIETISRTKSDIPQIAYNSEGRITVRIPKEQGDVLVVFDRPLSRELIRFIKNGITENPFSPTWCNDCANDLPF